MTNNENDQQWQATAKAPLLLVGTLLLGLGALIVSNGRWRYSLPIGAMLVGGGLALVIYSTTIHAWCAPVGAAAFGQQWGAGFWHGPSAWDCYHLVMGPKR